MVFHNWDPHGLFQFHLGSSVEFINASLQLPSRSRLMAAAAVFTRVQMVSGKAIPFLPTFLFLLWRLFLGFRSLWFETGFIGFHPMKSDLKLTHLMFADDVMISFFGNPNSLHKISDCLDDFGSWPGLKLNRNKTEVFTSSFLVWIILNPLLSLAMASTLVHSQSGTLAFCTWAGNF